MTIYKKDHVMVTLRFHAEFSNVMVIGAKVDTEDDDVIVESLQFQLADDKV